MDEKEAKKELKALLRKGKHTVYTSLNHVSSSGMFRLISCYTIVDNKPVCLDWYIDKLGHFTRGKKREGLRVGGCGMDMGFHVVYSTSRALYPKGFKVKGVGRNGDASGWDNDGGYRLKQHWLG